MNFQLPEHFESPRKHEEESKNLLNGIQAWCATHVASTDQSNDVIRDEHRGGKLDD